MTATATKIYNNLLKYYEKRCSLNVNVPPQVGCAEAVSFILQQSGVSLPQPTGISGTATLYEWLSNNPAFLCLEEPEPAAIIISPSGYGNGTVEGHTGFLGKFNKLYTGDYGIVSNDSNSGLLLELWDLSRWDKYYGDQGGLPVAFFRAL